MSSSTPKTLEASVAAILSAHFENCENPHETIYKIWLLLHWAEVVTETVVGSRTLSTSLDRRH